MAFKAAVAFPSLTTMTPSGSVAPRTYIAMLSPISGITGGIDGSAGIVTISPADGSEINADPDIARFTPIVAAIQVLELQVPFVYVVIGTMWWLIYDGIQFSPFFAERSTVAPSLTKLSTYNFSIIPNGGWWRSSLRVEFISGQILAQE